MNCPQCKSEMIKARVSRFTEEYDYCRACKKELKEIPVSLKRITSDAYHDSVDYYSTVPGGYVPVRVSTPPPPPPPPVTRANSLKRVVKHGMTPSGMHYDVVTNGAWCRGISAPTGVHEMLESLTSCNCGAVQLGGGLPGAASAIP